MPHRTALLLALVASAQAIQEENFVDGQCATNDGADHFPYKSEAGDQFTDVISADYSLLWEVAYYDSYKVVKNGDAVHALHQCGVDAPTSEELPAYAVEATLVEVPVTAVATIPARTAENKIDERTNLMPPNRTDLTRDGPGRLQSTGPPVRR